VLPAMTLDLLAGTGVGKAMNALRVHPELGTVLEPSVFPFPQ
jgi:hypothetical protein